MNYYNEFDPKAAQWLRNLIDAKLIPYGHVDDRSIADVLSDDLSGYAQCHFFAGIGGWSLALQLAGWPETRPVWTGSCPCQPFSVAGRGKGTDDKRHLWPGLFRLIAKQKPPVVFGEQVASTAGLEWLDGVSTDLENEDYAIGSSDLCAAGVNSPQVRQRLFWVADSRRPSDERWEGAGNLSGTDEGSKGEAWKWQRGRNATTDCVSVGRLGNSNSERFNGINPLLRDEPGEILETSGSCRSSFWNQSDVRYCQDGKARRVEPGLECLVNGLPFKLDDGRTKEDVSRKALLYGFGNAIVPQVAAEFIAAFMEL
jgi:DNA (cytosine-5)-methyltransferase 1